MADKGKLVSLKNLGQTFPSLAPIEQGEHQEVEDVLNSLLLPMTGTETPASTDVLTTIDEPDKVADPDLQQSVLTEIILAQRRHIMALWGMIGKQQPNLRDSINSNIMTMKRLPKKVSTADFRLPFGDDHEKTIARLSVLLRSRGLTDAEIGIHDPNLLRDDFDQEFVVKSNKIEVVIDRAFTMSHLVEQINK